MNFQAAGGELWAPRRHGPREDGESRDIFEGRQQGKPPFMRFVENWDLYHRLDGEVHCGTNVLREMPAEK